MKGLAEGIQFDRSESPSSTKRNRNVSIWLGIGFVKNKRS